VLKHALELSPDLAAAHQLLGYALLAQGYNAEAIVHLDRIHDSAALGIAQVGAGQLQQAVENLQTALAQHPNDPDLLYYLGRASGLLAKQSIDSLIAAYPDSARAHQALAENYFVLRQMPQAEKDFLEALRLRPDTPELHLELGLVYAGSSQWPKAEAEFRAQSKLQPGNAEAAFRLGSALLQQGNAREARTELQRADRLQPEMPETLYALGKAASLAGDPAAAEKAWTKLLSIENGTSLAAQTHFALAGLYRKQGKPAEAERETREFQKLQSPATQPERTQ
jgi:tetratricopeptide (TPR) repeat protein